VATDRSVSFIRVSRYIAKGSGTFTVCLLVKDTSRDYFHILTPDILNRKHCFLCVMDVLMLSVGHWIVLT
jgi:hypothetical protein